MGTHSKFFRVAAEGGTTDGRTIEREWIEQMAKNFNRKLHSPRVWLEHIRGILPDSSFKAYGDVTALKTEEADLGDGKKRLILLAQIEPLPELLAMNKKKQKLFTSCEIAPSFADTGEAYLMGLAVTDSPASLGTEVLQFAANAQHSPFASRKHDPNNLFSEPFEQTGFLDGVELSTENPAQSAQAVPVHYAAQPMQQAMQQPVPTPQEQMFNELKQATEALKAMSSELSAAFSSLAEQTSAQGVEQYSTRKPVSGRPVDFGGNVIDC